MLVRLSRAAPLLFLSGMCALIYQIAWLRELRLIFGASTAASAATLAVFMGGLGVGGLLLGRRADRHKQPLALYANLELMIAGCAAITPVLVFGARKLYIALGGAEALGSTGATIARLVLTVVVLGAPTLLMGGTLPAAARAVSDSTDLGRRKVAALYGVNTFGAVLGAFSANFLLLEVFGTRITLWIACLINALIGMVARIIARQAAATPKPTTQPSPAPSHETGQAPLGRQLLWFPPAAAAIAGFAFLLMELVWYRMLGPILGGSSYSFGLILCVALAGIGLGSALYPVLAGKRAATITGFAWTCALEALCIMVPYAIGDGAAVIALLLRPLGAIGMFGHVLSWSAVTSLVVLPAAIVSGYQFPLIISLFGSGNERLGRHVGIAYAANTLGAIAGSLAGGFGLIPLLSAPGCWRATGLLLAVAAVASAALAVVFQGRRLSAMGPIVASVVTLVLTRADGPTAGWRHNPIGAGRADRALAGATGNSLREFMNSVRRHIVWQADGKESSVALQNKAGLAFIVNGKSDGNARADAPTQVMGALIGAALLPSPRSALVVGLGTGSTAGWLARVPGMQRVEVAELEPVILRVARECAAVNEGVMDNPKVHITVGDAREILLTSRSRFDLVFSEPSNPYRAGISSLYTREFYEAVATMLSEEGIFLQWLQYYDVDGQAVRTAAATIASVFPSVSIWLTQPGDMILAASRKPISVDVGELRARVQAEPFRSAMTAAWRVADLEGFVAHHIANPTFVRLIAEQEGDRINSDDSNQLEYAFAASVGKGVAIGAIEPWQVARKMGMDRMEGMTGALDWNRVDARRVVSFSATIPGQNGRMPPAALLALYDEVLKYNAGDLAGVRATWKSAPHTPETFFELSMIAEALAVASDPAAVPFIEKLRVIRPGEAAAIWAAYLSGEGKLSEAVDSLRESFRIYRTDPWASMDVMSRALDLAVQISGRSPGQGEALFQAMEEPFSVQCLEASRILSRFKIAGHMDFQKHCVEALAPFLRFPIWTESFLAKRRLCYHDAGLPEAAAAEKDFMDFIAANPSRLGAGLPDTSPSGTFQQPPAPSPETSEPR